MKEKAQVKNSRLAHSYVRFSTAEQALGDSERRQIAQAEHWCAQHNYTLNQAPPDKGVSAYHGKHRETGNLGRLLRAVKPGQPILIENIDRWSREDPLDSNLELRKAVNTGTEFVFLNEGVHVTKDNFASPNVRYMLFFGALRANSESARKSELIKADWDRRKALAASGKAVQINRLPCWLEWKGKTKTTPGYPALITRNAAVVRRLFQLAGAGRLILDICRKLRGTPAIMSGAKPRWNPSSVRRILTDRAATGHYTGTEPPTPNVWPRLVSEETFCIAQSKLAILKRTSVRAAHSETNLFTGLALCARCGLALIAHTSNSTGSAPRLVCGGASKGRSDCTFHGVPLDLVERSFLAFLADSDLIRSLLTTKAVKPSKLDALQAQLVDSDRQASKLAELIFGDDNPPAAVYNRLKQEENRAKSLASEIETERVRVQGESPALESYNAFRPTLMAKALDKAYRPQLRAAIASVLDSIELDPKGKAGCWNYQIKLKGESLPVPVWITTAGAGSWSFQSLRPPKFIKRGQNRTP
jgi:DNA invertase Pin-like site-specific DNA recombinase